MTPKDAILTILGERGPGKTICPSEAARRLGADWRPLMEDVRAAGLELAALGLIEVTQKGSVVNPEDARGAIRYRRIDAS